MVLLPVAICTKSKHVRGTCHAGEVLYTGHSLTLVMAKCVFQKAPLESVSMYLPRLDKLNIKM